MNSRMDAILKGPLRKTAWTLGVLWLTGCSIAPQGKSTPNMTLPAANVDLFTTQTLAVPSHNQLSQLLPAQRAALFEFIKRPNIASLKPREQVAEFIDANILGFTYEGMNYSASDALSKRAGNCMSLAMLTYAVAKELNVAVNFQVIYSAPILLDVKNDLAISSDHVRSILFDDVTHGVYISDAGRTVIDYFPDRFDRSGAIVSEETFWAMYYRNLAADALIAGNLNLSYALSKKGLQSDPHYSPLINIMAIVHRRRGDLATASHFYQYGLEVSQSQLALLSNYRQLLLMQGDVEAAQRIEESLAKLDDPTPYAWFSLGREALLNANYRMAEMYLTKFVRDTPYFHQGYFELARAQQALGDTLQATKSLEQAIALASLPDNQRKYQAKLQWLKTH